MINLNLNTPILNLDGSIIVESENKALNVGKTVANYLSKQTKGDAIKFVDWAKELYKGNTIIVDNSDFKTIYELFKNSDLPALIKAAILNQLDKCEKISSAVNIKTKEGKSK